VALRFGKESYGAGHVDAQASCRWRLLYRRPEAAFRAGGVLLFLLNDLDLLSRLADDRDGSSAGSICGRKRKEAVRGRVFVDAAGCDAPLVASRRREVIKEEEHR
jgi:hypothetical protein